MADDPTPDPKGPEPDPTPEPKQDPPAPPWGKDEDFDPQRAWKLLQDVREDARKAKADRDALKTKVDEHERANESAAQKAEREKQEAIDRATTAEAQALRLEVALDKAPDGMSLAQVRKLAKRLAGGSKEELEADAEELFAEFTPNGDGGDSRRPKERLRPGAAPSSEPEENDPEKLAKAVSRGW